MTPKLLAISKAIHEARIAFCWGPEYVGRRDPWPNFDDPKVLRAYPHNPIPYVDIALEQGKAVIAYNKDPKNLRIWCEVCGEFADCPQIKDEVWLTFAGPHSLLCGPHAEERLGRSIKLSDLAEVPSNKYLIEVMKRAELV